MIQPDKVVKNLLLFPWWLFRVVIWLVCLILSLILLHPPKVCFPKYHAVWFGSKSKGKSKKKSSGKKSRNDDHDDDSSSSSSRKASKPSWSSLLSTASSSSTNTNNSNMSTQKFVRVENGKVVVRDQYQGWLYPIICSTPAVLADMNEEYIVVTLVDGRIMVCSANGVDAHYYTGRASGGGIVSARWQGEYIYTQYRDGSADLLTRYGTTHRRL